MPQGLKKQKQKPKKKKQTNKQKKPCVQRADAMKGKHYLEAYGFLKPSPQPL